MAPGNKTSQQHTKVAYRPLTDLAKIDELDLEAGGGEADDDDREELETAAAATANDQLEPSGTMTKDYASTMRRSYHSTSKQHTRQVLIGLRQLRTILLALAALLSLIFLLKLIAYSSQPAPPSKFLTPSVAPKPISSKITWPGEKNGTNQVLDQVMSTNTTSNKNLDARSKQQVVANESDNYLSSIIYERDHRVVPSAGGHRAQQQQSEDGLLLDDFRYSLGDRRTTLSDQTQDGSQPASEDDYTTNTQNYKWWSVGKRGLGGQYTTVINFIRPMKSFNHSTSVTLATHLTLGAQSFRHTLELCERWQGPISVAVHLSRGLDNELPAAITLIKFVRQCLPGPLSACMRDKLTWHLVFAPANRVFAPDSLSYPKYHLDAIHYSAFANTDQCPKLGAQDGGGGAGELIGKFERDILRQNKVDTSTTHSSTPIPENVLRNVARSAVKTKWVLTSNVDMYPSLDLGPRFISLITSLNDVSRPRLFALPTFELINCTKTTTTTASRLRTKEELVKLVTGGQRARVYQEPNCDRCHQFARMQNWLALVSPSQADNDQDSLTIFDETTTTGESENRQMWQPFSIAESKLLPEYNEALASDRSEVMLETCLKDYQTVVLADAFLVRQCQSFDEPNQNFVSLSSAEQEQQQKQLISQAQSKLRQRYHNIPNINKCLR